jgi:hypothetical protein
MLQPHHTDIKAMLQPQYTDSKAMLQPQISSYKALLQPHCNIARLSQYAYRRHCCSLAFINLLSLVLFFLATTHSTSISVWWLSRYLSLTLSLSLPLNRSPHVALL